MQLQPAVVVTKAAYLRLYPDDTITARYVVDQRVPAAGRRAQVRAHRPGDRRQRRDRPRPHHPDLGVDRRERRPPGLRRHRGGQGRRGAGAGVRQRRRSGRPGCTRPRRWVSQRRALLSAGARTADRAAPRRTRHPRGALPGPGAARAAGRPVAGRAGQEGLRHGGGAAASGSEGNGRPPARASSPTRWANSTPSPRFSPTPCTTYLGADGCPDAAGPARRARRRRSPRLD